MNTLIAQRTPERYLDDACRFRGTTFDRHFATGIGRTLEELREAWSLLRYAKELAADDGVTFDSSEWREVAKIRQIGPARRTMPNLPIPRLEEIIHAACGVCGVDRADLKRPHAKGWDLTTCRMLVAVVARTRTDHSYPEIAMAASGKWWNHATYHDAHGRYGELVASGERADLPELLERVLLVLDGETEGVKHRYVRAGGGA